jgi:hypothetical protein
MSHDGLDATTGRLDPITLASTSVITRSILLPNSFGAACDT